MTSSRLQVSLYSIMTVLLFKLKRMAVTAEIGRIVNTCASSLFTLQNVSKVRDHVSLSISLYNVASSSLILGHIKRIR